MEPLVSVIIPVYNDGERLGLCLEALAQQTYSPFEVVVVDNGSTISAQKLVESFGFARYAYEPQPGSYIARNHGLTLARGAILAFTDSDCIPRPDWLAQGVQQLSQLSQGGVVAGQVQLFYADPLRPTAAELYDSVIAFPQRRYIEQEGWGVTANLFTHRAVLARVGMFNPHLKSSGDKEWGQRATQAGYRAIYAPTVQVGHPARSTFEQLSKRDMRRVGGWHDLNQRKPFPVADFMVELLRDLRPQPAFIGGLVRTEKLSLAEKLTVFGVRMSIQYVKAGERIRLFLGGTSRRS